MTELLKNLVATAAATAVFIGGIFLAYISKTTADKANSENRSKLDELLLNKHLTVIQAYNQNNTQVTENQLLTFVKV